MKKWLLCLVFISVLNAFSQDRIYFDCSFNNKVKKSCNYADIIEEETHWQFNYYNCGGILIKSQGRSSKSNFSYKYLDGLEIIYNYDGSIYSTGNYSAGKKDGLWIINESDSHQFIHFYQLDKKLNAIELAPNRDTLTITYYKQKGKQWLNARLKSYAAGVLDYDRWYDMKGNDSTTYYHSKETTKMVCAYDSIRIENMDTTHYTFKEEMPKYMDGQEAFSNFLSDNLVYPPSLYEAEICGSVWVSFVVTKDGTISNVRATRCAQHPMLEREAIRVIKLTQGQWIAGRQGGKPVNVKCLIPIDFTIE
jgi:TonB family protein